MLVKDVMKREVATVGPDASVALAARVMRDQDVGCLPVLEREQLIGMITDRDIVVRGVADGLDPHRATFVTPCRRMPSLARWSTRSNRRASSWRRI